MTTLPDTPALDPQYVEARRALLNALFALAAHHNAVIVVGAQAVYLRTGDADPTIAIAPFTSDGDLALDPSQLGDDPTIENALRGANFQPYEPDDRGPQPGAWVTNVEIDGQPHVIPLDLMVPEGLTPRDSHRGVKLGVHGNRAARKVRGLEAAVFDNDMITITALDPADSRSIHVKVAGPAALLIAKAYKIAERLASGKANRYDDKDAADVLRLMQSTNPADVAHTMLRLVGADEAIAESTRNGLDYLRDLFGKRNGEGVAMAHRALREAVPEERITVIATAYVEKLFLSMSA